MSKRAPTSELKFHKHMKEKKFKAGDYQKGRELAKAPKSELKAFDVAQNAIGVNQVTGPPVFETVNTQINGAELYQRVGRKVLYKKWVPFMRVPVLLFPGTRMEPRSHIVAKWLLKGKS